MLEKAKNEANLNSAIRAKGAATAELRALEGRLQGLEAAKRDCENLESVIHAKSDFASTFIGKMFEMPGQVRVEMPPGTWGGVAAGAFAITHNNISERLTRAAESSIGEVNGYKSKLNDSQSRLVAAMAMIAVKIATVQANIAAKKSEISGLSSSIAAYSAKLNN
jgi:septal ring factor EnvC (AmiA/AmiB activator)